MGIKNTNKISVIGLGYVGLPILIKLFQNTKLEIIGFDCNKKRIKELNNGIEINNEVNIEEIINKNNLYFSSNVNDIDGSDVYIVTIPTPLIKVIHQILELLKNLQ